MKIHTVYVELLEGSGTPVFMPLDAICLNPKYNFYRIIETYRTDLENLRFIPPCNVFCLKAELSNKMVLVAYSEISKEMVEYFNL